MSASPPKNAGRPFPWPVLGRGVFAPNDDTADAVGVVLWWERRRLAYNAVVCLAGAGGMIAYLTLDARYGDSCVGDMAAFQVIAGFVGANVCYTAGWMLEALVRTRRRPSALFGPRLLAAGLAFSLAVAALPAVMVLIEIALHVPPASGAVC
jgi:hypothetical protein